MGACYTVIFSRDWPGREKGGRGRGRGRGEGRGGAIIKVLHKFLI